MGTPRGAIFPHSDDERLRELYSKLAEVERGHYGMLLERYEELKKRR